MLITVCITVLYALTKGITVLYELAKGITVLYGIQYSYEVVYYFMKFIAFFSALILPHKVQYRIFKTANQNNACLSFYKKIAFSTLVSKVYKNIL